VRDSGEALLTILTDIRDFSKMEAGRLDLGATDFELAGVVASVTTLMAPRAREKDVALEAAIAPDVPSTLRGDAGRLRQVLLNLVGNAIKFTEAGAVRVSVERVGERNGLTTIRVAVSDTGIGVPDEAQRRLFQEFSQVSQPDGRRFGGTGLGLAISKRIVTAMGGEIGMQSAPGRGSTFWFTVTLPRGLERATTGPARVEAPLAPLRILVAEDNPMNQQVALGLLRRQGHTVDLVPDGRAAVEAVGTGRYDVVLMDVHMPGVDGLEATRRIRRLSDDRRRIPIIALTASVMRGETEQCLAAGMDAQLPKPIDPIALAAVLSQHAPSAAGAAAPDSGGGRPEPPPAAARESDPPLAAPRPEPEVPPSPARGSPLPAGGSVIDEAYIGLLVEALGAAKVRELVAGLPDDALGYRDRLSEARQRGDL
jgi:CheY-like chemotaxis protein